MLEVGKFSARGCNGIRRRAFLQASFSLPLSLGLNHVSRGSEQTERPRAKSVIVLWLWGGPSHIDTFDPKPKAPVEVRGPFAPIATSLPGAQFSELFPRLAQRSHLFSVLRTNVNLNNAHDIAGSIALTGAVGQNGNDDYGPNLGSIVQRVRAQSGDLPTFTSIAPGKPTTAAGDLKGFGGGIWGEAYDPFYVRCNDRGQVDLPALKLLDGLTIDRLSDRRRLQGEIDVIARSGEHASHEKWNRNYRRAYRLLTSPEGRRTFDLSRESQRRKGQYGRTLFGQSCLLARRLVESGVPYVQVNWSKWVENIYDGRTDFGWDTHWLNFEHLTDRHGPILDRAMSGLLDDLNERGLLESTLVVAMGEFGRTPKISGNGGRDHWANCYCSLWAGGGVQPGRVIGESDRGGFEPVTQPTTPAMTAATILELAGIRSEQRAQLRVLQDGSVIEGLVS
jgi:hypothetical protein